MEAFAVVGACCCDWPLPLLDQPCDFCWAPAEEQMPGLDPRHCRDAEELRCALGSC